MKYGKIAENNKDDLEDEKVDLENTKVETPKKNRGTKVNFDGHLYDLEDGHLVNYIEIYIPFLRTYLKINSCKFFQSIFGINSFHSIDHDLYRSNHSCIQFLVNLCLVFRR